MSWLDFESADYVIFAAQRTCKHNNNKKQTKNTFCGSYWALSAVLQLQTSHVWSEKPATYEAHQDKRGFHWSPASDEYQI